MPGARAHATVALLVYVGAAVSQEVPVDTLAAGAAIAGLASLAPDLDRPGSCASRLLWPLTFPLSLLLGWLFGHRGAVHALATGGVLTALLFPLVPESFWLAAVWGWHSHLLLDAGTPRGVELWPGGPRLRLGVLR